VSTYVVRVCVPAAPARSLLSSSLHSAPYDTPVSDSQLRGLTLFGSVC
jgi:hypothetical protein